MATLEVLICTLDDGITAAAQVPLPPQTDVCYLISWQQSRDALPSLPAALQQRDDVRVVTLKGRGLSANRNNALRQARGDLLLLADDDTRYRPEGLAAVLRAFAAHPEADILTFQAVGPDGRPIRPYPATSYDYGHHPRGSYVCSWEIACRRRAALPPFDERFGLGTTAMTCGEEEVFLHTAYRRGLHIRYLPQVVAMTPDGGTGLTFLTAPGVQRAKGGVLCVIYGVPGALLRCLKCALTLPRGTARLRLLREMLRGLFRVATSRPRYTA